MKKTALILAPFNSIQIAELNGSDPDMDFIRCSSSTLTDDLIQKAEIIAGIPSQEWLMKAGSLKWLQLASAGADNIMKLLPLLPPDLKVTNAAGAYGTTVSEHMLALILALMRHLDSAFRSQQQREWKKYFANASVEGSAALIIGMGDIGSHLGRKLRALGARVTGVRRTVSSDDGKSALCEGIADEVYGMKDLDRLIPMADIVALCLPDTFETQGILSRDRIARMRSNAIVVNAGRGSAIDQDALVEALREKRIAAAGLDVTIPEPLPADNPLWSLDNVILTAHNAGGLSLATTLNKVFCIFTENLTRYRQGLPLMHRVDRERGY
ncbi:MAG TPA: D-2-hydroxyacid dehydrogenase [Clostridiales bacterium]|nr:D-2-hydroxyacid dehydrogenase [Clostridiales bacterium]